MRGAWGVARFQFQTGMAVAAAVLAAGWAVGAVGAQTASSSAPASTATKKHTASTTSAHHGTTTATHHGTTSKTATTHGHVRHAKSKHAPKTAKSIAKSRKLQHAFVASSQLRPMAQQLATNRTPSAYAAVLAYAHSHPGDAAAAAYLALGHAYLLDRNYASAISSFTQANEQGESLDDYADYLTAQAEINANELAQAETMLRGFAAKHPDSIFVGELPVTIANLSIQQGDPQTALRELNAHSSEAIANHADYLLALARAQQMSGNLDAAAKTFRRIYLDFPLSGEAMQAKLQLQTLGAEAPLTIAERRSRADALYAAQRYGEAGEEYRTLANDPQNVDADLRQSLNVAAAACDYKMKRITIAQVEALPDSANEAGARRLYLLMEMARDRGDVESQQANVKQLEQRFPGSPWLAEALYSSGNMYMLRKDNPQAIAYYLELARLFPSVCHKGETTGCSNYAPSAHWRGAWLTYREGNYSQAAVLFDQQIANYPGGKEIPSALYWRGRIYLDDEQSPQKAAAYFEKVSTTYLHYYYAQMATQRLSEMHGVVPIEMPQLSEIHREQIPPLTDDVPEDDVHVVRPTRG
jgi:soluble lytic murein transglycosylase